MEATILHWISVRTRKETGHYYSKLGLYKDNGRENGSYCSILGLYKNNGKENGKYY